MEKLRVGQATGQAARAMLSRPMVFALPLVTVAIAEDAGAFLEHRIGAWSPALSFCDWIAIQLFGTLFAMTLTSAMYLRALDGGAPTLRQIGEVRRFNGWQALAWDYFVRVLGWGLLIVVPAIVILHLWEIAPELSGVWEIEALAPIVFMLFYAVMNRYAFAVPLFAQRGAIANDLFKESAISTRPIAWPMALLGVVEGSFVVAHDWVQVEFGSRIAAMQFPARVGTAIAFAVAQGIIQAYLMVKTGLMVQVVVPHMHVVEPDMGQAGELA